MSTGPNWTDDDDNMLLALVEKHGSRKWAVVARALKTKSSKQCRRRFINVLSVEMKTTDWSAEEDIILVEGRRQHGNKWSMLAILIGGRTDNAVKNRWAALCKKDPRLEKSTASGDVVGGKRRRGTRRRQRRESSHTDTGSGASESASETEAEAPMEGADSKSAAAACEAPESDGHPMPVLRSKRGAQAMQEVQEALESEEPDDVPLLPFSPPPPGAIRPPYRGLSITIPPDDEDLPETCVDPMSTSAGGGLNIRIYQGRLTPKDMELLSEINAASNTMLRIEAVPERPHSSWGSPLQWGSTGVSAGNTNEEQFESLLGFLSTVFTPRSEATPSRMHRDSPLHGEHRQLLRRILDSASSTPSDYGPGQSAPLHPLQHSSSTAADVAARLQFVKAPSMTLDGLLNRSLGSGTFMLDGGPSNDWQAAAAAAVANTDGARSDVSISPHCSEEELAMLLEALIQPSDPTE